MSFLRSFLITCLASLFIFGLALAPVHAQTNPEDAELKDEVPTVPAAKPSAAAAAAAAAPSLPEAPADSLTNAGDIETAQSIFDFGSTFSKDFIRQAMLAGVLVALLCGYLGVYVVLKRIVFVGVALAEVSSAGIALALLLGLSPILGSTAFMLIGIGLFSIRWSPRRVPSESYIGIVYCIAAAVGILFIAKSAQGETHMLKLLQGDVLTVTASETWLLAGIFTGLAAIHALFAKEFVLVSFDRDAASTLGFNAGFWDFLLFLTIGAAIAFSIHSAGVLLTSTMLILPAATALLLVNSMGNAFIAAPLLGIIPVVLGIHASLVTDYPASAVIVALSFLIFLVVLGVSKFVRN